MTIVKKGIEKKKALEFVPLKANQVRTRINKSNIRTYYIVAEDHNHEFHCLWFRTEEDAPMMMITPGASYRPTTEDIIVLDNINLLTSTFADIVKESVESKKEKVVVEEAKEEAAGFTMANEPIYSMSSAQVHQLSLQEWQKEMLKYMTYDGMLAKIPKDYTI